MANSANAADQHAIDAIAEKVTRGDMAGARVDCQRHFSAVSVVSDDAHDAARKAPFHFWMGVIEQRSGTLPAAIEHFDSALAVNRRHAPWLRQAASAHFESNSPDRAEHLYRAALRIEPRDALSHYNLGILLQLKHDWQGARRAFEAALTHQPRFAEALVNLANTLIELSDLSKVEACYRRALEISPRLALAHHGLGRHLLRRGRAAEAADFFASAVDCDSRLLDAWLDLAECRHLSGNDEGAGLGAIACVEHVLAIAPIDSPAYSTAQFKLALYRGEKPATLPHAMVARLFADMAGTFDEHLTQRLGYRIPALLIDQLKNWLTAFPARGAHLPSVCDLGCGTGLFGVEVGRYSGRVVGVDLSAAMIAHAHAHGCYDELIETDLLSYLSVTDEKFDLIAATDVVLYVGRLEEMFELVAARLSEGGRFAFTTESPPALDADFALLPAGRFAHHPRYILRLAEGVGMNVVAQVDATIRTESGLPLAGHIFILEVIPRV